ncbi:hypothetical protein D3C78_1407390 [compost metagenome]
MYWLRNSANCSLLASWVEIPLICISPSVGLSRQPMMFINVDFPEPDAPTIATISPGWMERETFFSTATVCNPETKCREIPLSEINAEDGLTIASAPRQYHAVALFQPFFYFGKLAVVQADAHPA